jgi:O-antigen ligase
MEKNKILQVSHLFYYALVFLLPFTSLPLASKLLGSEMVAAPSILILFVLLIITVLSMNKGTTNIQTLLQPVLIFGLLAIFSSLLAFWLPIPIQKDFSIFRNIIEGIGTLLIGITFYFVTIQIIQSEKVLNKTLQIIAYSFIPLMIWSLLQFVFGQIVHDYPTWMITIQKYITTSGTLYRDRLTGFAFEPSWLAHQLNMFYIPIWISATANRQSVFKRVFRKFILEDFFFGISIFILLFSKSRVGWITFIVVISYLFIAMNQRIIKKIREKHKTSALSLLLKSLPVIFIFLYILLLITGLFFFSKFDSRMETLFEVETYQNRNLFSIANEFVFAERILYWQTGWHVFNDYPILGVGLENVGFFFEEYMPSFAWALDEPRHLIYQANYQGNVKNLWIRLVSETGIIGFLCFGTWLILLLLRSYQFQRKESRLHNYWGLVGKIALLTLLIEGFSIDTFALPYYWIIFGFASNNYLEGTIES